jgi:hypothetical protein
MLRPGWIGRTRRALAFGLTPDTILVALSGFLLRGGIVLLLLPSAVLPSVIGIANVTGVAAFGIDGRPSAWLIEVLLLAAVALALWLVLALLLGALTDVWLIQAAVDSRSGAVDSPRPLPDLRLLLDLAGIRALCAVPLIAAIGWAASRVYQSVYNELLTPRDLATPLVLRVIEGAVDAVLVVGLAWLASEVVGAIAVRRLVLAERGIWRSIREALAQFVRRPATSIGSMVLSYGASLIAIGFAMTATATAFDWCRLAARNPTPISLTLGISPLSATRDFRPAVFIFAAVALVLSWLVALGLAGVASAWRSSIFTAETADALSLGTVDSMRATLGLSGLSSERSGD